MMQNGSGVPKEGDEPVVIDAHIHLWDLSVYKRRDWLQDKQDLIRDFTPADAAKEFAECGVDHGIVVEAVKYSLPDNLEWLRIANDEPLLLGAVPGCYLDDDGLPELLDQYARWDSFLGVRASPSRSSERWDDLAMIGGGLSVLEERGIVLEVLVGSGQLPHIATIMDRFSGLTVVINHCGLPSVEPPDRKPWTEGISALKQYPGVFMKYSAFAMITKSRDQDALLRKVTDTLFDCFGPERLIWGSNWPVDSLWASYRENWETSRRLLPDGLEPQDRAKIYGGTALRVYGGRRRATNQAFEGEGRHDG